MTLQASNLKYLETDLSCADIRAAISKATALD